MQIKHVDSLGIDTSRLGFGFMRLPKKGEEIDIEQVIKMVDNAMAKGLTYFDTAWVYHDQKSEGALKTALVDRYPRNSFTIADKMPMWHVKNEEDLRTRFAEMRERLGVDYIDFLLLHSLDAKSWEGCKAVHANEYQLQLKKEGKIRFAGFSFHDKPEVLRKILSEGQFDFCQLQINYFDWSDYAKDCYEIAKEFGKPIIVMEPIRGGMLAALTPDTEAPMRAVHPDWTDAQWALRFVADLDQVAVILSGMSNEEQVEQNLNTFAAIEPLTDAEKDACLKAQEIIRSKVIVPCTGCKYCMPCPFDVDIPTIYRLYNEYQMFGQEKSKHGYQHLVANGHGADKCQKCGACTAMCPQAIVTADELPAIHEALMAP